MNNLKSLLVLIVLSTTFLNACAVERCKETTPPWPIAGHKVAEELSTLNPTKFPAFIEWLGRLDKLQEQLEVD